MDADIYNKLTDYCAYRERCGSEVKQKLQKLKVDKSDYEEYINRLQQHNYLNEERYVKYFVSGHEKKKWGKTKIKAALAGKKIDAVLIKKYLDEMDEDNYEEQIKAVAEKKWNSIKGATLRDRKTKLLRFLLGKGYEMNKALAVLKTVA